MNTITIENGKLVNTESFEGILIIPEGVESIGDKAFAESKVTKLVCPSSLKRIGKQAFAGCLELKEIQLNDGLEFIDDYAFDNDSGCKRKELIDSIKIPSSVKHLGKGSLNGIKKIFCESYTDDLLDAACSLEHHRAYAVELYFGDAKTSDEAICVPYKPVDEDAFSRLKEEFKKDYTKKDFGKNFFKEADSIFVRRYISFRTYLRTGAEEPKNYIKRYAEEFVYFMLFYGESREEIERFINLDIFTKKTAGYVKHEAKRRLGFRDYTVLGGHYSRAFNHRPVEARIVVDRNKKVLKPIYNKERELDFYKDKQCYFEKHGMQEEATKTAEKIAQLEETISQLVSIAKDVIPSFNY